MSLWGTLKNDEQKVLAVIEKDGAEVVSVVTVIGNGIGVVKKLVSSGETFSPELKTQFGELVQAGEAVATAVTVASAASGANWTADAAAVASVEKFVPVLVATLKLLKADAITIEGEVVPDGAAASPGQASAQ